MCAVSVVRGLSPEAEWEAESGAPAGSSEGEVVADQIVEFCSTVASEEEELKSLKLVLGTQVSGKYQTAVSSHLSFFPPAGNSEANL